MQRYKVDVWIENFEATIMLEDMQSHKLVRGRTQSYFGCTNEDTADDVGSMIARLFKNLEE